MQRATTDLGTGTVITTPFSSGGLADTAPSKSELTLEFDRFLQSGREYDFLTRRGMRDWLIGSGMRTQLSSKWTCTRLLICCAHGAVAVVVIMHDIESEMMTVDERAVEDRAW